MFQLWKVGLRFGSLVSLPAFGGKIKEGEESEWLYKYSFYPSSLPPSFPCISHPPFRPPFLAPSPHTEQKRRGGLVVTAASQRPEGPQRAVFQGRAPPAAWSEGDIRKKRRRGKG